MDLGGEFPPTAQEIAAKLEADQAEKEAKKAAAKAEATGGKTRSRGKADAGTKVKLKPDGKVDLRPEGHSPVIRKALNVVAGLAVIGVLAAGYLFFREVQEAERVTQLVEGQCVENFFSETEAEFRTVFLVDTTDCANPHAYEVFSTSESVFGEQATTYPGVERTFEIGQEYCQGQYDSFVGGDFASSPWQVWTFVPTEPRWIDGDRKVQCLIGDAAEETLTEGSLRGAGS